MPAPLSIEALQNGNTEAYRLLVETYQDQVVNTCYGFVQKREDAEDLAQEVFIEVFRSVNKFRKDAQLSTWVYRIAVNKSLEYIRYHKRKKRFAWRQSLSNMTEAEEPASFSDHPGMSLEQKERAGILMSKIALLPENQRIAFTLNKIEDLAYKEIAEIMNLSLSSVESLMHRAKKNLRKHLQKLYLESKI